MIGNTNWAFLVVFVLFFFDIFLFTGVLGGNASIKLYVLHFQSSLM